MIPAVSPRHLPPSPTHPLRGRSARVRPALAAGVVAALIGFPAPHAVAATFYVERGNPGCSNSGAGTEAQPYCTITAALNARAAAGNTIVVKPGVYPEQVSVPASGAAGSPIAIQAAGPGVVVDGADDFSNAAQWTLFSGDVWLASSVTWNPRQVFLDGARTDSSGADPALLPPRSRRFVPGTGLYVNAGGGSPAGHQARIGRRNYGFTLPARSFIAIDGFTVTRTEDRGIYLSGSCTNVTLTHNTVNFTNQMGIQAVGGSAVVIGSNTIHDCSNHGIAMITGVTGSTVEDNECYRNINPTGSTANGIHLYGSPANVLRRNNLHDNEDTGLHIQTGSNDCVQYLNRSWRNGDHGFDHLLATGTIHVGDVAFGNFRDGFSIEGTSTGTQLHDCIAADNGLTTGGFDLTVDAASVPGFVSDYNIFWKSTAQAPFSFAGVSQATIAAYRTASGQDASSLQADPRFVNAAAGDFHLIAGSPAIDNGNSAAPNWPSTDAEGLGRFDDPATPDAGVGPVTFSDRGALEFRVTGPPPPPGACSGPNLISNPSFETGTQGWKGEGCTIQRVPGGSSGSYSCRLTGPASTSSFALGDGPNWIASTTAGSAFKYRAWVRSESGLGIAKMKVREYVNGSKFGEVNSPELALSPAWQLLEVDYVATQNGSTLDLLVKYSPTVPSESFEVDDLSICAATGAPLPGPHAALTVAPLAGAPPLPVTADASASSAVGGTIVSYRFDFGDGTVVGPQPGATAAHTFEAGQWTVRVLVTDDHGATDEAAVTVRVGEACAGNMVGNPSFETGLQNWKGVGCTIAQVAGGRSGSFACRLTGPASTSGFGVQDSPNWITTTPATGAGYHFIAWVRAVQGTGRAKLKIREYLNGVRVGETNSPESAPSGVQSYDVDGFAEQVVEANSSEVMVSTEWQPIEVDYFAVRGGSTIDLQIKYAPAGISEIFDVDDVSICPIAPAPARALPASESAAIASAPARIAPTVAPNPLLHQGTLSFSTGRTGLLRVAVFDLSGRRVRTLADREAPAGLHILPLDGRGDDGTALGSGIYFFRIESSDGLSGGRFLIVK